MYKTAALIVVGSEFFSRDKKDTNSIWLTEELEKWGVRVLSKSVVGDELEVLTKTIRESLASADLVITTGGLGPTEDDRTREAAARALGRNLVFHPSIVEELERRYARRGNRMAPNNRRQAYIPEGSRVMENPNGTAPGFLMRSEGGSFLALPGPPSEMSSMFERFRALDQERFQSGQTVTLKRILRVTGLGESDMDERISDLYRGMDNPEVTINFTPQDLEIHLTARGRSVELASALLQPLTTGIKERLEGFLYSDDDRVLADVVIERLAERGLTLAVAESVTGGLLAHRFCSVSGASRVFRGGIVSYTDVCKERLLGVKRETLDKHTAVSEAVAKEMAEGALERLGTDLALSCTGFAGPEGGTDDDPVGTIYIGFATPEGTTVTRVLFPGGRNLVRSRAAQRMLFLLFRHLSKN